MKALSIRQPWAHAIIASGKNVENRTWTTHYRGPLLIHAGLHFDPAGVAALRALHLPVPESALQFGGIIGVAELVACVRPISEERRRLGGLDSHEEAITWSRWYTGQCAWLLERPQRFPFSPLRGRQGLFEVQPSELCAEARAMYERYVATSMSPKRDLPAWAPRTSA